MMALKQQANKQADRQSQMNNVHEIVRKKLITQKLQSESDSIQIQTNERTDILKDRRRQQINKRTTKRQKKCNQEQMTGETTYNTRTTNIINKCNKPTHDKSANNPVYRRYEI